MSSSLLQIYWVKPFSEPAVDFRQHVVSFFPLALLLPQMAQSHTARSSAKVSGGWCCA
jgi:hypothetical protein